jgi:hypothetical protein
MALEGLGSAQRAILRAPRTNPLPPDSLVESLLVKASCCGERVPPCFRATTAAQFALTPRKTSSRAITTTLYNQCN